MEFKERLYRLRIEQGVYQKELAAYLHVSVGTISNYENGIHSPDLKSLCKIANFFHVSTDYLLGRTEYLSPIGDLNRKLVNQYTSEDIMNTIIALSNDSCRELIKYLDMLKMYDERTVKKTDKKEEAH